MTTDPAGESATLPPVSSAFGSHFSCALSAVLLARVQDHGGDAAVAEVLARAGSTRSVDELRDIVNWISYDEATALWRAGAMVTHHPQFARAVGTDSARRLNSSPVATLLRSLGSPEKVYRQIAVTATKYSTVARLEAVSSGPGFAEIVAAPSPGFVRDADHCAWTCGLLSQPTILFGLPAAHVEHERCASFGAPACEYRVTWEAEAVRTSSESSEQIEQLQHQLTAMKERLGSMFATAGDLIGAGRVEDVLARIAKRAAIEVRAPRYLLAVRMTPDGEYQYHQRGISADEVASCAGRLLELRPADMPESWLVVPVRSGRQDYGRLLAMYDDGVRFFPEERELLEVYARYAASALDSAAALLEAEERYRQSSALLQLARALSTAGTSAEVARRLSDSVSVVVDCDRVGVYLWEDATGELVRKAITQHGTADIAPAGGVSRWKADPGGALEKLLADPNPDPFRVDRWAVEDPLSAAFANAGFAATIVVPLAAPNRFLGLLTVSVTDGPERLELSADLRDRLSGVAAQAATALQNGQLVDQITHQAMHDQLTGLSNRVQFTTKLRAAIHSARGRSQMVTLLYLDLDRFKPVNDEFGHAVGDLLLVDVSERLRACVRAEDLVARLGGDEFAVLLSTRSGEHVDRLSDRIQLALSTPFMVEGAPVTIGVSIGRAAYPAQADDADTLMRTADAAMFDVKHGLRAEVAPQHPAQRP
jgi:diguanylate cyclase (GGDEF)-like protein